MTDTVPRVQARLGAAGVATLAVFAVDLLVAIVRARAIVWSGALVLASLAALGVLGVMLGWLAVEWICGRIEGRGSLLVPIVAIAGAAASLVAVWTTPYPWALTAGCVAAATAIVLLDDRLSTGRFGWLVALGAAGALAADLLVFPGLYLNFHDALVVTFLAAIYWLASRRQWRRGWIAPLVAGLASTLVWWGQPPVEGLHYTEPNAQLGPAVRRVAHRAVDLDADGYSSVLGGSDCAPLDPAVHPGACERWGDGIDSNCNGLDAIDAATLQRGPQLFDEPPDIVIFMIDTFRADFAGLDLESLPAFAALERESVRFTNAYTPFPSTQFALRALLGSVPAGHPTSGQNLTQWLGARGYEAQVLSNGARHDFEAGDTGFVELLPRDDKRGGTLRTLEAFEAFQARHSAGSAPTLTWIHTYDLHAPLTTSGDTSVEQYRAAVREVDGDLARIREAIASRARPTLLVVTGDHGEEFGEHGGSAHSRSLYDESVRVPLWVWAPGLDPARLEHPVSLIDIPPTIAHALGHEAPEGWRGTNLFVGGSGPRYLSDAFGFDSAAGANLPLARMIRGPRYKLIANIERSYFELYDLEDDPGEREALPAWEHPDIVDGMLEAMREAEERRRCRRAAPSAR